MILVLNLYDENFYYGSVFKTEIPAWGVIVSRVPSGRSPVWVRTAVGGGVGEGRGRGVGGGGGVAHPRQAEGQGIL